MTEVIRPQNSVLLFKLQSAEGTPASPSASADAIPYEADSLSYTGPYRSEATNEVTGSLVKGAPLVVGQPSTVRFRSRMKGAGAGITYTSLIKPPLHQVFGAAGMRGLFTAAVSAAALTAGTTSSGTLGTGFGSTARAYVGMPLLLSVGPGAGHMPLITEYTAGKLATLSDLFGSALTTSTLAALPANWTYAGTSPGDAAERATDQPCGTLQLFEDGVLHQWNDCRCRIDFEGDSARPGFAVVEMTGTYVDPVDAAVPAATIANHSAPLLLKGSGLPSAILVNRKELAVSRWTQGDGGSVESPDDPNTVYGFGAGQIGGREPMFGADPLATLVATRNTLAEIAAFSNYPIALRFGATAGNRWSMLLPQAQPVSQDPGTRGQFRSHDQSYRALTAGRDAQDRDMDRILSFS